MWYNLSMKEAAVITENNEVAKIPPVESSLLPLSPTVVAVAADQNVSVEIVEKVSLDELALLPESPEDIQSHFIWKFLALYPLPRQQDIQRMEINSFINKAGVSITMYASKFLPKGMNARYIFDWIFNQGCWAAQNSDSDKVIIKLPSDPFDMFCEVTGYTGKRGHHVDKQLTDFLDQLHRMSTTVLTVRIKKEEGRGFSTFNSRVIDSMHGWADDVSGTRAAPIKNTVGRPSRKLIQSRNSRDNHIVLAPEFVKRVIRKGGSHSKNFPIDSNIIHGMTMVKMDVMKCLWHFLWQASVSKTNEASIPWSYFIEDMHGQSPTSAPVNAGTLRERKRAMKKNIAECIEIYNHQYQKFLTPEAQAAVKFESKFVRIIGGPPVNALNYQVPKQQIKA